MDDSNLVLPGGGSFDRVFDNSGSLCIGLLCDELSPADGPVVLKAFANPCVPHCHGCLVSGSIMPVNETTYYCLMQGRNLPVVNALGEVSNDGLFMWDEPITTVEKSTLALTQTAFMLCGSCKSRADTLYERNRQKLNASGSSYLVVGETWDDQAYQLAKAIRLM